MSDFVLVSRVPPRFRSAFPFERFGYVPSACFEQVMCSDDDIAVFAPSGSGRTSIAELGFVRGMEKCDKGRIVYTSPKKVSIGSLKRKWEDQVTTGEITEEDGGGNEKGAILFGTTKQLERSDIFWATDSILLGVSVFIFDDIDEMSPRGFIAFEAVVSRILLLREKMGIRVRIIITSEIIPNYLDIAAWIGIPHEAAVRTSFANLDMSCRLSRHVYGYESRFNDVMFDKTLDRSLKHIVDEQTGMRSVIILCRHNISCVRTAVYLSGDARTVSGDAFQWGNANDKKLDFCLRRGIAYHTMETLERDRIVIQNMLAGRLISIVCATLDIVTRNRYTASTIIVKGSEYHKRGRVMKYRAVDVRRLMAIATKRFIMMVEQHNVMFYNSILTHNMVLESFWPEYITDIIVSDVCLGLIHRKSEINSWIASTFVLQRMLSNPISYDISPGCTPLRHIGAEIGLYLATLKKQKLVSISEDGCISPLRTAILARRYRMKPRCIAAITAATAPFDVATILHLFVVASESVTETFLLEQSSVLRVMLVDRRMVLARFLLEKDYPWSSCVRLCVLIESVMLYGCTDTRELNIIFDLVEHIAPRVFSCLIDVMIHRKSFTGVSHALTLKRCISLRLTEYSQSRCLAQIKGLAGVEDLVYGSGYRTIGELRGIADSRLDTICKKRSGWSLHVLDEINRIPYYCVSVKAVDECARKLTIRNMAPMDPIDPNHRADVIVGVSGQDCLIATYIFNNVRANTSTIFDLSVPPSSAQEEITVRVIDRHYVGIDSVATSPRSGRKDHIDEFVKGESTNNTGATKVKVEAPNAIFLATTF